MSRVMEKLRAAIREAETMLNAIAKLEADRHVMRISASAAKSVGEARARFEQEPDAATATQILTVGLLDLARTRLELFSLEFHSNMARETRATAGTLAALVLAIAGTGFAAIAVAIAIGDEHRVTAAAVSAVVFVSLSALAGWATWRTRHNRERALELSLAELENDLQALKPADEQPSGNAPAPR